MGRLSQEECPLFPSDVPIARLSKVSLERLTSADDAECKVLSDSCKTSGFFLLDLSTTPHGLELLQDVEKVFDMAQGLFDMDLEEKLKYSIGWGKAYGYKATGGTKVDRQGTLDRCEFWGLSKDDLVGNTEEPMSRPELIANHQALLDRVVRQAHKICLLILTSLEGSLGLEQGKLTSLHRLDHGSADQLRLLKMPPQPEDDRRTSLLAHTDFGSVTLVWNIIGGLQILPPGTDEDPDTSSAWEYVQPQHGCVVVNMGDAMVDFSGGVLRSNLHRVGYAPGDQASFDRYSVAYFARPEDNIVMEALDGLDKGSHQQKAEQKHTASEWGAMKAGMYRDGKGTMKSSGGIEKGL